MYMKLDNGKVRSRGWYACTSVVCARNCCSVCACKCILVRMQLQAVGALELGVCTVAQCLSAFADCGLLAWRDVIWMHVAYEEDWPHCA